MAIQKQRQLPVPLLTTQTVILPVVNTSGVDLGNIKINNTTVQTTINLFISVVPTGATMNNLNSILWNIPIGPSGLLSLSEPTFLASGDTLMGSGSVSGLNFYTSYLKLN